MDTVKQKQMALELLAPYYKNPSLCGYEAGKGCSYLTKEGKMCVAGKCMVNPANADKNTSIEALLKGFKQEELFKPEYVGVFTDTQWLILQTIHDTIARGYSVELLMQDVESLGLFTLEELASFPV